MNMEKNPNLKPRAEQSLVSKQDLEANINALNALTGGNIDNKDWKKILIEKNITENKQLLDALHDYLLEHGYDIQTTEDLNKIIEDIENQEK